MDFNFFNILTIKKKYGLIQKQENLKNKNSQFLLFKLALLYKKIFGYFFAKLVISNYELKIVLKKQFLLKVSFLFQKHSYALYKSLIDIIVVDYPGKKNRFRIIYHLLSFVYNSRIRFILHTNELEPIPSLTPLFKSANWSEREVWDLYGITFVNHPDLRRILTDYGFDGHPLRKDFPLTGFLEVFYDDSKKRIIYVPVTLVQVYKNYKFDNPWIKNY